MSATNFCKAGGVLVGPDHLYGPEPYDFAWPLADVPVGCNRLRCKKCGELVRSGNHFGPGRAFMARWLEALRAPDWDALVADGVLAKSDLYRLYVCACSQHAETSYRFLDDEEAWLATGAPPPWSCDGHPRLALPATVDGVALDDATDFDALAARALAGRQAPTAGFGAHWLSRVYHLIKHHAAGARLSRAVLAQIASPDAAVRVEAVDFFRRNPTAPGGDELVQLGRDHRDWFAGVTNPKAPDTDLMYYLLQALACRLDEGDHTPLPFVEEELLKPGPKPGYLIGALTRHAPDWLHQHRGAILAANLQLARLL
jgi:hypothetical protein